MVLRMVGQWAEQMAVQKGCQLVGSKVDVTVGWMVPWWVVQ